MQAPPGRFSRANSWLILALTLAGIARIIYLLQFMQTPLWGLHRADHHFYREWGRRIAGGELSPRHVFEQGPLYAYLLGAWNLLFGSNDLILMLAQTASGLCLVWWTYRIGQIAFTEWTARIAAIVTGLYGPIIFFECLVMKSFLTVLGSTLFALLLLLPFEQGRPITQWKWFRSLILSSAVVGLLCLIRENYLLLLPIVIWSGLQPPPQLPGSWRLRLAGALAPLVVVAGLTAPAAIHNVFVSGEPTWITSGGGEVLYMAWAPEATGYYKPAPFIRPNPIFEHEDFRLEASRRINHPVTYRESSRYWSSEAVAQLMHAPGRALRLAVTKLLIALNDFEVPDSEFFDVARQRIPILNHLPTFGWTVGLGLVGIILSGARDRKRLVVASVILVHLVSIVLIYNFSRFRIGMLPAWILFASFAIARLGQMVFRPVSRRQRIYGVLGGTAAASLSLLAFLPPPNFREMDYVSMETHFQAMLDDRNQVLNRIAAIEKSSQGDSIDADLQEAELCYAAKLTDRAETLLVKLLQKQPDYSDAHSLLAVIYGTRGEYSKAEAQLLTGLKTHPENVSLWANLGNVRFHQALQGTLDTPQRVHLLTLAKEAYERGLQVAPTNTTCQTGLHGVRQSLEQNP